MKLFFFLFLQLTSLCHGSGIELPKIFKKANFIQHRYIKASDITLNSSGEIYISEKNGLVWFQKKPFEFKTIIEKGRIYHFDGNERKEVENASVVIMSSIISDLLKGKVNSLQEKFSLIKSDENFIITPKDHLIKKIVKEIRIVGEKNIKEFILEENSGNFLKLSFSNQVDMNKQ